MFDKWGMTRKFNNFASLREPTLFEDFKKSAPEWCVVYFNEEKVSLLSEAALFADEYMVFVTTRRQGSPPPGSRSASKPPVRSKQEGCECGPSSGA